MSLKAILLAASLASTLYTVDAPDAIPLNQEVQVRGFAYRIGDEAWVLAPEPNVKSCCVDKATAPRIYILQNMSGVESNRAYTFAGVLAKDGQQQERFILQDPQLVVSKSSLWPPAALGLAAALGLGAFLRKRGQA